MSVSVWTRKSHHICLTSSSKSARQRSATSQLTMITKVRDITTISSDNQHSTMIRQFPRQQSTERTNTEFKSVRLPSLIQVFYAMTMKLFSTECCSSRVLTTEHVRRILTTILNISVNNRNFRVTQDQIYQRHTRVLFVLHTDMISATLKSIDYNVAMTFILNNNNNNNDIKLMQLTACMDDNADAFPLVDQD